MHRDIGRWVRACLTCCRRKLTRPVAEGQDGVVCEATRWWQAISIDLVEASESSKGYRYVLTVIDLFSRYVTAVALKSKRAKEVSEALFDHVFMRHGRPERIHSDEGKEFVNKALARMYKHWDIVAITTGGYRPWSNPVERYHRFMNASMTTLSERYDEDWPAYIQATVFCYNASMCESTGHTPYFLGHGREPNLMEDLAMARVPPAQGEGEVMDDIVARLETAYTAVCATQRRMAAINLERRKATGREARVYDVGDTVLYWEPAQPKVLRSEEEDTNLILKKAPGKWKPRWTGPHSIVAVQEGRYSNRYTMRHGPRKREIENVKSDKLRPYTPWSSSIVSTSSELDAATGPFAVGAWCKAGDLFIVPLAQPYPFGVGKVLEAFDDGRIRYQWYGAKGYGATSVYEAMWWDGRKSYRGRRRNVAHGPFEDKETGMVIRQEDLVLHGFTMTRTRRLREAVLDECARNADIWWMRRSPEQRNRAETSQSAEPGAAG